MADTYDPYREALVLENRTVWPEEVDVPAADRARVAAALHAAPDKCSHLEYVRIHSGFCRTITVTPDDVARIAKN
ncbi:MAG TPA: hypothetical protein PLV92_00185 [Pirellulaceae bacterium]|nr:hypothetical protein [Pirellulaceae bacterium]